MKRSAKFGVAILFVLSLNDAIQGQVNWGGEVKDEVCSSYSFHFCQYFKCSWEKALEQCSDVAEHRGLVSMESEEEWEHLKGLVNNPNNAVKGDRWYIGLKNSSHKWCWLSITKACINDTLSTPGEWRWGRNEPNNPETDHCVEMFKDGSYNDFPCNKPEYIGYICEKRVECNASGTFIFKIQKTTVQASTTTMKPSSRPGTQTTFTKKSTVQPYSSTYACTNAFSDNVFKIQKNTVQPFITKKKYARRSDTQPTFNQKSTVQPSTYGFILWRKRSPRNTDAGIQNNRVIRSNQPRSSENVNESADSVNIAVIIDDHRENSQQTRHARMQSHYASLDQATMMEQTGVHSFAVIERTEMEEMNHGHPVDYLNEMQLNENELDRPVYMNFTVTSHDYINV